MVGAHDTCADNADSHQIPLIAPSLVVLSHSKSLQILEGAAESAASRMVD
jgi:hypothetical protein